MRFTSVFAMIALLGTGSIGAAVGIPREQDSHQELSPAGNRPEGFAKRIYKGDILYRDIDETEPAGLDKRIHQDLVYRRSDDSEPETLNKRLHHDIIYRKSDDSEPEALDKRIHQDLVYRRSDDSEPEALDKRLNRGIIYRRDV